MELLQGTKQAVQQPFYLQLIESEGDKF